MSVELEIRDGVPHWWLSPDLWTVPGADPDGTEGPPLAGQPCYIWARVTNSGTTAVVNATVRFYWANPAVGVDRSTATLIGSAFVSLDAGEVAEVLCLTPWVPTYVNEGHECILAEAFHTSLDPLPGTSAFNVPTDRHVAQRNLSVVMGMTMVQNMFSFPFEIHNTARVSRAITVRAAPGNVEQIRPLVPTLGPHFKLPSQGEVQRLGFVNDPCPGQDALDHSIPEIKLELGGGQRSGFTLVGSIEDGGALIHVEMTAVDQVVGGLSVLAVAASAEREPKVCPQIEGRVPDDVIQKALEHPETVRGWGELANPNIPFHPVFNIFRTSLTLQNPSLPFHPLNNSLVFMAGCR